MNRTLSVLLAVCLSGAGARADGLAERVVERALRAHGGESALAKTRTMIRSETGNLNFSGDNVAFSCEITTDLPDRYRLEVELGPQKIRQTVVVSRDQGWQVSGGVTIEMDRKLHAESREEGYVLWLTTLVPLRREKGIQLTTAPAVKVDNQLAAGVKVSLKGRDDINLYFDEKTGLLARMTRKTTVAGLTAEKEYLFGEYKEFEGAKLPMKRQELMNGRKYMEGKVGGYRFPARVDDKSFAKP